MKNSSRQFDIPSLIKRNNNENKNKFFLPEIEDQSTHIQVTGKDNEFFEESSVCQQNKSDDNRNEINITHMEQINITHIKLFMEQTGIILKCNEDMTGNQIENVFIENQDEILHFEGNHFFKIGRLKIRKNRK